MFRNQRVSISTEEKNASNDFFQRLKAWPRYQIPFQESEAPSLSGTPQTTNAIVWPSTQVVAAQWKAFHPANKILRNQDTGVKHSMDRFRLGMSCLRACGTSAPDQHNCGHYLLRGQLDGWCASFVFASLTRLGLCI